MLDSLVINIVASPISYMLGWASKEKLAPFVRGLIRDLPKLDKTTWHRVVTAEDAVQTTLEISQLGSSIRATVTRNGNEKSRKFEYKGQISGQQLVLTWADEAAKEQIIGSMVLHLSQDLRTLSGMSVYFKHAIGRVVSIEREYKRVI